MTDRVKGFQVTLKKEMRIDDAEAIINAISLISHVASVKPIINEFEDTMNREMIKSELTTKLWDALQKDGE